MQMSSLINWQLFLVFPNPMFAKFQQAESAASVQIQLSK
jgi:hypothetical protein